jgi:hypothetical protein
MKSGTTETPSSIVVASAGLSAKRKSRRNQTIEAVIEFLYWEKLSLFTKKWADHRMNGPPFKTVNNEPI